MSPCSLAKDFRLQLMVLPGRDTEYHLGVAGFTDLAHSVQLEVTLPS